MYSVDQDFILLYANQLKREFKGIYIFVALEAS